MMFLFKCKKCFFNLNFVLILSLVSYVGMAQIKGPQLVMDEMGKQESFDKLIEYALDKDYFIQAMDSKRGFVQIKVIQKGKGIFGRDRRLLVNYLIDETKKDQARIRVQINEEIIELAADGTKHYDDLGRAIKEKLYVTYLEELLLFYEKVK